MASKSYKTPKHCIVHRIDLHGGATGYADIGYRCSKGPTSQAQDEHGRTGPFKHEDGGTSTYPSKLVRGVRSLDFRGMTVIGEAKAHFVLSPAAAVCHKPGGSTTLSCKLVGDTSSKHLSGAKRQRRRKRR